MARTQNCDETVIVAGNPQPCDRPLDAHGYCDRPGEHVEG
jgi:hypothetical protein